MKFRYLSDSVFTTMASFIMCPITFYSEYARIYLVGDTVSFSAITEGSWAYGDSVCMCMCMCADIA